MKAAIQLYNNVIESAILFYRIENKTKQNEYIHKNTIQQERKKRNNNVHTTSRLASSKIRRCQNVAIKLLYGEKCSKTLTKLVNLTRRIFLSLVRQVRAFALE